MDKLEIVAESAKHVYSLTHFGAVLFMIRHNRKTRKCGIKSRISQKRGREKKTTPVSLSIAGLERTGKAGICESRAQQKLGGPGRSVTELHVEAPRAAADRRETSDRTEGTPAAQHGRVSPSFFQHDCG